MSDKQKQARRLATLSTISLIFWVLSAAIGGVTILNGITIGAGSIITALLWAAFVQAGRKAR